MEPKKQFQSKHEDLLVDEAYRKLEEMIVTAELKPGSIVSETEVANHLGLGRTPVREAFKKLVNTHLVQFLPRKGILIRVVSVDELLLQMEPRQALETLVIGRATRYAIEEERNRLGELAGQYTQITENWSPAVEALRVDDEFNHLICRACRNPFLADALLPLHAMARRQYYCNYFLDKELTRKVNNSHVKLMLAIADGTVEQAKRENDELLENVRQFNSMSLSTWFPDVSIQLY